MRVTMIQAQPERKRQDRCVPCAEKRRRQATTRPLRGLIRPTRTVCLTADAPRSGKSLFNGQFQAILRSNRRPLGECRIRWASDRVADCGVIGIVTNAGFIDSNSADGMRAALAEEFSSIYIFHLRGNQRTSGEESRREGGKIFGAGSRAPIAITILVKGSNKDQGGNIKFFDIGDYLSREEKLRKISELQTIGGIDQIDGWAQVTPNEKFDWINQRGDSFDEYLLMGSKKNAAETLFSSFSNGVVTGRDSWVYGYSRQVIIDNCCSMVAFYNQEIERLTEYVSAGNPEPENIQEFVKKDLSRISWGGGNWQASFQKRKKEDFDEGLVRNSLFRPYTKMWHYGGKRFNHSFYSMEQLYPEGASYNPAIMIKGNWRGEGQIALMVDRLVCLQPDGGAQCFPMRLYNAAAESEGVDLFSSDANGATHAVRDGITDAGLKHFQDAYSGETITKEDLFYYVYGLLHSEDYRAKYSDNLSKELPRIPRVKTAADFWAFSRAGRTLGDLHVNYETVEPYPVTIKQGDLRLADTKNPEAFYRVTKWAFGKTGKDKDKTTVIYNPNITMQDVPLEAYDYVVNGKPALEWVMERQVVKTDKASGIENDANRYANETMNNPAYPMELFQRVITVSLRTMEIVRALPKLEVM